MPNTNPSDPNRTTPPKDAGVPQPAQSAATTPGFHQGAQPAPAAAGPGGHGDLAGIMAAALALAQDLRARNWPAVMSGAMNLLQLVTASFMGPVVMGAGPNQGQPQGAMMSVGEAAGAVQVRSAATVASDIEALCKPHQGVPAGTQAVGFSFDWKKLLALAFQAALAALTQQP